MPREFSMTGMFKSPCCRGIRPRVFLREDGCVELECDGVKFDIPCRRLYRARFDSDNKVWQLEVLDKGRSAKG